jgi:hypothetical protein
VIASLLVARKLMLVSERSRDPRVRLGIPIVATIPALAALWAWQDPGKMLASFAGSSTESLRTSSGILFEFGAFPDSAHLVELKRRGLTAVISLQSPQVPVERAGIAEEERVTKSLGIKLVHAPMLPWFSRNEDALKTIGNIARTGRGLYYVHCGLGRDRVNIAKKYVEDLHLKAATGRGYHAGLGFEYRTAPLANGPVFKLAPGVWMIPFPDREEIYGCILEGSPGTVVFAVDADDPAQRAMLDTARSILTPLAFPFVNLPVHYRDSRSVAAAADSIHRIPPPLTVIVASTPGRNENNVLVSGQEGVAFRKAFSRQPARFGFQAPPEDRGALDTRKGC